MRVMDGEAYQIPEWADPGMVHEQYTPGIYGLGQAKKSTLWVGVLDKDGMPFTETSVRVDLPDRFLSKAPDKDGIARFEVDRGVPIRVITMGPIGGFSTSPTEYKITPAADIIPLTFRIVPAQPLPWLRDKPGPDILTIAALLGIGVAIYLLVKK